MSELEQYLANPMKSVAGMPPETWPLPDERHLAWWRALIDAPGDVLDRLGKSLPQIRIAADAGISKTDTYASVVFRGEPLDDSGLRTSRLAHPQDITLRVHRHYAGSLPVIETPHRADFVHMYRALGSRCEPVDVPGGVHALFVSGIPNAGRMQQLKGNWGDDATWPTEMKRLLAEGRSWFYDRLILMHQDAAYGGVPAKCVSPQLTAQEWISRSGELRLEHEFTHYATSRILGSFRLNIHDELIADFMGFTEALGMFSADVFLEAMGVAGGRPANAARFHLYTASLDEAESSVVCGLMVQAAANFERLAKHLPKDVNRAAVLMSIASIGLSDMATAAFGDATTLEFRAG